MSIRKAAIAAIGTAAVCGTTFAAPANGASADDARGSTSTAIKPGTLDRGKRAQALHMKERRIYDGKRSFTIKGPKGLNLVGKGDGGYVTVRYGRYHGHLWQIRPRRKARRLGLVEQAAYNGGDEYLVSDNGNGLAITEPERTGFFVWVRALPSGKQLRFQAPWDWTRAVAFPKNRVLFTTTESTYWYNARTNKRTKVASDQSDLADPGENRLVVGGDKGEKRYQLVEFRDPSTVLAEWQHGAGLEVSPDGKHFLAKNGKNRLQIRSLSDGHLVRTFYAAGRIDTDSARWESDKRVLFSAKGHRVAANIRCTIGGACKRSTGLARTINKLGIDWP